jgi:tetratricopeptide (TPR) repeat protein
MARIMIRRALLFVVLLSACGPAKPAQSGDPTLSDGPAGPAGTPASGAAPPASNSPDVVRGVRASEAGDWATAQSAFEAAVKANPNDAVAQYNLGLAYEHAKRPADAETAYKAALAARADFADAAVALSSLLLTGDPPRLDAAATVVQAALAKHPENGGLQFNLGVILATKGDQPGATKAFDAAVKSSPDDANAHFTYGHWLGVWGNTAGAEAQLGAALGSTDVGVLAAVGHEALLLRAVGLCVAAFDKAIAGKDLAELRTERGLCKLGSKDPDGAMADFAAAVKDDANYPLGHYWLGVALASHGKLKEAIAELDAYLKLAPDGAKAKDAAAHKHELEAKVKGKK